MTGAQLEELTYRHLPDAFLHKVLAGLYNARATAWRHCYNNYRESEADNLLPFECRARIEGNLKAAAELVPGLTVRDSRDHGAWWSHVEVRSGPMVMTASAVPLPCAPVRSAMFRDMLARSSQGTLWDEDPLPEDAPLYVLLLHSRYPWRNREEKLAHGHLPGSVYLAWPQRDMTYVHSVNLLEKYADVVEANTPPEWDNEARLRYIYESRWSSWL
jgi:hypothetical protein